MGKRWPNTYKYQVWKYKRCKVETITVTAWKVTFVRCLLIAGRCNDISCSLVIFFVISLFFPFDRSTRFNMVHMGNTVFIRHTLNMSKLWISLKLHSFCSFWWLCIMHWYYRLWVLLNYLSFSHYFYPLSPHLCTFSGAPHSNLTSRFECRQRRELPSVLHKTTCQLLTVWLSPGGGKWRHRGAL